MRTAVFLLTLVTAPAALAADANDARGFYFGAGGGASNVTVEDDNNSCCDNCCYYYGTDYQSGDSATSFTAYGGYRFTRYVAVEVGYLNAGTPKWDDQLVYVSDLADLFNNDVDLDLQATQLSVVGILPFARVWNAYLKAGATYWWADADQHLVRTFDGAVFDRSVDDDDVAFHIGLGVGVNVAPAWQLRLEFQSFDIADDLLNTSNNSTLDSVLLELQFEP